MADKDFVVKNGLVVNTNLLVANGDSNRVGINTDQPDADLAVIGSANVSGNVYANIVNVNDLYVVGNANINSSLIVVDPSTFQNDVTFQTSITVGNSSVNTFANSSYVKVQTVNSSLYYANVLITSNSSNVHLGYAGFYHGNATSTANSYINWMYASHNQIYNYAKPGSVGGTSSIGSIYGTMNQIYTYGADSGNVVTAYGFYSAVLPSVNGSNGNFGTSYGYYSLLGSDLSTATTTTAYHFYGSYPVSANVGTKWGIYLDREDKSYFSGNVGINNTAPTHKLSVNGDALINTNITVGNTTVNSFVNGSLIQVVNATATANLTPNLLKIGNSVVNATHIVSNTLVQVSNATNIANLSPLALTIGNSVVNATHHVANTLVQVSNATNIANLSPLALTIGSSVVNSTYVATTNGLISATATNFANVTFGPGVGSIVYQGNTAYTDIINSYLYGISSRVDNYGRTSYGWGLYSQFYCRGTNSTNFTAEAYGVMSSVRPYDTDVTSVITTAYAFSSNLGLNSANSRITTAYHLYGAYPASANVTTKWGIYLSNETKSYFSGLVGIGNSAPTKVLSVSGDSYISGNLQVAANDSSSVGIGAAPGAATKLNITGNTGDSGYNQVSLVGLWPNTAMTTFRGGYSMISSSFTNRNEFKDAGNTTTYGCNIWGIQTNIYNGDTSARGDASLQAVYGSLVTITNVANGASSNTIGTVHGHRSGISCWGLGGGGVTTSYGFSSSIGPANTSGDGDFTTAYGFYSTMGLNTGNSQVVTGYHLYGTYPASANVGTKWGIYLDNETKNYLSGNVGIGNTVPTTKLSVNGDGYFNGNITALGSLSTANLTTTTNVFTIGSTLYVTSTGNVGIGIAAPTATLQVNGSFAATTKSFLIHHPTKPGKMLQYASLEGPENGVYVRGKCYGFTINLPDYWMGLVNAETITVNLTPFGRPQELYVSGVYNNIVNINSKDGSNPECYYQVFGERKDVEKLVVEF